MARPSRYPPELRERAVRMVAEVLPNYPSEWPAMVAVADKLGIGTAETVRKWGASDRGRWRGPSGYHDGGACGDQAVEAGNAELRRAKEILKAASAFFAAELDRPGSHS